MIFFFFKFWEIHSGDTDAVLPLTATRYSIKALNLQANTSWYAWYDKQKVNIFFTGKSQNYSRDLIYL